MAHAARDTTVFKVSSGFSPKGRMGQIYLATGKRVSMRLWNEDVNKAEAVHERDYETVGYVIQGRAELEIEGQKLLLETGDSWLVPAGVRHHYRILERFVAIEATAPPAQVHGRDEG